MTEKYTKIVISKQELLTHTINVKNCIFHYSKSEGFLTEVTCSGIDDTGKKIAYVCINQNRNIDVMNILSNHCLATGISVPIIYYGQRYIKVIFDLDKVAEFSEIE